MLRNIKSEDYKEFYNRFEKMRENNLPTPCEANKKQTPEYVYFNKKKGLLFNHNNMILDNSLVNAFSSFINEVINYAFISKKWIKNKHMYDAVIAYQSCSSFEDVVKNLYDYPESFKIPDSYKSDYSKQQLNYLNALQKYLLFIGLKDKEYGDKTMSRYRVKYYDKFLNLDILHLNNKEIEKILKGDKNYIIRGSIKGKNIFKRYKEKEYQHLIMDEDFNIRALIEYTYSETKGYKIAKQLYDFDKDIYSDKDAKMVVDYFKVVEKYSQ